VHRPSLTVLKRYGTSTQQTYAYSLLDHLNWLRTNQKSPSTVTLDDLQRYMNGLTGQADGLYGAVWRRPEQRPLGPSAAGNVATIVKAYYLVLAASHEVSRDVLDGLGGPVGWPGQPLRAAVLEAKFARERQRARQGRNVAGAARAQRSGERASPISGVGCYLEELENCCDVCLI
jgi:hypothetical protein